MLRNCKGFSLVEVVGSFSIIVMIVMLFVPILMKVYEERTMLDYKKDALLLLHNEKESFLYDDVTQHGKEMTIHNRHYLLTIEHKGELTELCMHWEVPWKEKGKVCDYAMK